MNEYYIEVTETHYINVYAETDDEAFEIAQREIVDQVPDCIDAEIIKKVRR